MVRCSCQPLTCDRGQRASEPASYVFALISVSVAQHKSLFLAIPKRTDRQPRQCRRCTQPESFIEAFSGHSGALSLTVLTVGRVEPG